MSFPNAAPHSTSTSTSIPPVNSPQQDSSSSIAGNIHLSPSPPLKDQSLLQPMDCTHSCPASHCSGSQVLSTHLHTVPNPGPVVYQTSTTSGMAAADVGVFAIRMLVRLTMLIMIVFPVGFVVLYRMQKGRSDEPLRQLRAFARKEAANNKVQNIEELPVSGLKLYAQAACVRGSTVNDVKEGLRAQLRNIPKGAREDIISSAVMEGMDAVSTRQDTSADLEDSGTAFSYLAYWNTKYNGDKVLLSDRYSTCIMAAGVDVKVGEEIADYEHTYKKVVIGTRPCECGHFWCVGVCPEYDMVHTTRPVFKRHRLTLKNQIHLHQWMVKQAVNHAESLVVTRELLSEKWNTMRRNIEDIRSLSWQAPHKSYFNGDDSAGDSSQHEPKQDL